MVCILCLVFFAGGLIHHCVCVCDVCYFSVLLCVCLVLLLFPLLVCCLLQLLFVGVLSAFMSSGDAFCFFLLLLCVFGVFVLLR